MTDIIRDIDEEMRRDAFLNRVRRFAWVFVVVVVLAVVAVAVGYFWQDRQARLKTERASTLEAALTLSETDEAAAKAQLLELAQDPNNGNGIIAGFEAAALGLRNGNADEAASALNTLAETRSGDAYAKAASIFAVYSQLDSGDPATLIATLDPLINEKGAFEEHAMELKALIHVRTGEADKAIALLDDLLGREGLDRDLQSRVQSVRDSL